MIKVEMIVQDQVTMKAANLQSRIKLSATIWVSLETGGPSLIQKIDKVVQDQDNMILIIKSLD
jgi:hypothetical protein